MNFTNFWDGQITERIIASQRDLTSAGGAFGGSSANEKYPTEPSTVKEVQSKAKRVVRGCSGVRRRAHEPKICNLEVYYTGSVHVEINGDDNADDSTVSTRNYIFDVIFAKGIAQKSKSKKKVVVVTSDSASFPVRQGQNERKYQQQQQNVRVVAPKIEVSNKETVETFLFVRSIDTARWCSNRRRQLCRGTLARRTL